MLKSKLHYKIQDVSALRAMSESCLWKDFFQKKEWGNGAPTLWCGYGDSPSPIQASSPEGQECPLCLLESLRELNKMEYIFMCSPSQFMQRLCGSYTRPLPWVKSPKCVTSTCTWRCLFLPLLSAYYGPGIGPGT